MARTFSFFVEYNRCHLEEGYHIERKHNGKKVPFRLVYDDSDQDYPSIYWVICRTWEERRTIQRRVFGWR